MTKYEKLLSEYEEKLHIYEAPALQCKGLYCDNVIWIRNELLQSEKVSILAEEIGHHETTYGNILDQTNMNNIKQEQTARARAYNKLAPLNEIKDAYHKGYAEVYDMAEYLGVDAPFLQDSISHYESKYGAIWESERHQSLIEAIMEFKKD